MFAKRPPEQMEKDLQTASRLLLPYPSLRGWSWAANRWLEKVGAHATRDAAEKATYQAALKDVKETGRWSPVLDAVPACALGHAAAAEKRFRAALKAVAPGKKSVLTGPYRRVLSHPTE